MFSCVRVEITSGNCLYWLAIRRHSWALSIACSRTFAVHAKEKGPTQKCAVWLRGLPFGLDCGPHANPVEVNGAERTRGIRPLNPTRCVGPLLSIGGVGPHSWKGSRIDIDEAACGERKGIRVSNAPATDTGLLRLSTWELLPPLSRCAC